MSVLSRILVVLGILVGGFIAAVVAAALLLDLNGLIERYTQPALAAASEGLGREVRAEDVHVTWFPILGVEATGVSIAESERFGPEPFARAEALRAGIELWPALTSLGKDVRIEELVLVRPTVRVIRDARGALNIEDLGAGTATVTEPSNEDAQMLELAKLRAKRIAVEQGTIVFVVDGEELRVEQLGIELHDVALGQPLDLHVEAAILAEAPNLSIGVSTGPLPSALEDLQIPEIRSVLLEAEAFPVGRIPGVPETLQEALLTCEVTAKPTTGALEISGPVDLSGVASGEAATTRVGTTLAVSSSYDFGRIELKDTELRVADAAMVISGLIETSTPTWSNVMVQTSAPASVAELAALAGVSAPAGLGKVAFNLTSSGAGTRGRAEGKIALTEVGVEADGFTARGSSSGTYVLRGDLLTPSIELDLDASGLSLSGEGFAKAAGTPLAVSAAGRIDRALALERWSVDTGAGRIQGAAHVPFGDGRMTATARVQGLDLGALDRDFGLELGPVAGEAKLGLRGEWRAPADDPARGSGAVEQFTFESKGGRIEGSASLERTTPLRASIDVRGDALDADALLGDSNASPSDEPAAPVLPPSMAEANIGLSATFNRFVYAQTPMRDFRLRARVEQGKLTIQRMNFKAYGGQVEADGTVIDLSSAPLRYDLRARLESMNAGALFSSWTSLGKTLTGSLDSSLELSGEGLEWNEMVETLAGGVTAEFADGRFNGLDIIGQTVQPLAQVVSLVRPGAVNAGDRFSTDFRRLAGQFKLERGRIGIPKGLDIETAAGRIDLGGSMGLDQTLALKGELGLTPEMVSRLTGGKVKMNGPVPLGFSIGCSLTKPCVRNVDVKSAAADITKAAATRALKSGATKAREEIESRLPPDTKEKVEDVKEAAKDEAKKAIKNIFKR